MLDKPVHIRFPRSVIHIVIVLGFSLLGLDAVTAQEEGPPPAMVRVGVVRSQTLQSHWDVVGRLREVRRAIVAAEQPGRVVDVPSAEGDHVVRGESALIRIDDIWVRLQLAFDQAQLAQTRAGVEEAQALVNQATRDHQYLLDLLKAGSAKPKEVADAATTKRTQEARLNRAVADVQAAQATVDRSQEALKRLLVLAPFDGIIFKKMTEVGQWVKQGDPVAEIISRGQIDAVIDVPEKLINQLQVGQTVELWVEPLGLQTSGTLAELIPSAATVARTFPVKIRLDDLQGRLKPGMSVIAKVPTTEQIEVLTIPRDAVTRTEQGAVVWADQGGVGLPFPVKVLFSRSERYAVKPVTPPGEQALTPGTQVVIEGAERLFPGRPLMIISEPLDQEEAYVR